MILKKIVETCNNTYLATKAALILKTTQLSVLRLHVFASVSIKLPHRARLAVYKRLDLLSLEAEAWDIIRKAEGVE